MQTLTVDLNHRSYAIHIGPGLLERTDLLLPALHQKKAAIITNTTVAPLYLDGLCRALDAQGVECIPVILPDGEQFKNWETLNLIYDALLGNRCERNTTIIALGGGVIGDISGFAAATYLRGVPFIQVPTSLLAQVDSSVGGKTAINHPLGKNMIGAFHQPRLVLADIETLNTLPDRELKAGIAEVIKYGLIRDLDFFEWLEINIDGLLGRDPDALAFAIARSCENKAIVVAHDERESGERALLNLGHTFGHAIENAMGYGNWLHGEAVAAGTVVVAHVSRLLGLLDESGVDRITRLLARAGLPTVPPDLEFERYLQLMELDKKVEEGKMRFVVLDKIGQASVKSGIPSQTLNDALQAAHG